MVECSFCVCLIRQTSLPSRNLVIKYVCVWQLIHLVHSKHITEDSESSPRTFCLTSLFPDRTILRRTESSGVTIEWIATPTENFVGKIGFAARPEICERECWSTIYSLHWLITYDRIPEEQQNLLRRHEPENTRIVPPKCRKSPFRDAKNQIESETHELSQKTPSFM